MCNFTFSHYEKTLKKALNLDYTFVTCNEYITTRKKNNNFYKNKKIIINRVDIDYSCKKAKKVADIFNKLNIVGTFFVRLHANEYNPFSFDNYISFIDGIEIADNTYLGVGTNVIKSILEPNQTWVGNPARRIK